MVAALEGEALAAPQAVEDLQALVEPVGAHARVRVLAEGAELLLRAGAEPGAEHQPAAGEQVDRGRLTRQQPGAAAGQRQDHHADADPLGDAGHRRQHHPGVHHRRLVLVGQVVPDEEAVPAGLLGLAGQGDQQVGVGVLADVRHADGEAHDGDLPVRSSGAPRGRRRGAGGPRRRSR